jgi:hypothetical protein
MMVWSGMSRFTTTSIFRCFSSASACGMVRGKLQCMRAVSDGKVGYIGRPKKGTRTDKMDCTTSMHTANTAAYPSSRSRATPPFCAASSSTTRLTITSSGTSAPRVL